MRVLAVAQLLHLAEVEHEVLGKVRLLLPEPVGDGRVVVSGMVKGLCSEAASRLEGELTAAAFQLAQHLVVVGRVGDYAHAGEVLGRRAHHAGAADIDVLHGLGFAHAALSDGLLKGIEVDHHQIDGLYAQVFDGLEVGRLGAVGEDAPVDGRMQGLYPSVHDLGKTGDLRDAGDLETGVPQILGRASGGDDLDAQLDEPAHKRLQTVLV